MTQRLSNDALWEKLSEIDKKLQELAELQNNTPQISLQAENQTDFCKVKEEIISKIKLQTQMLGTLSDMNLKADRQSFQALEEKLLKILKVIHRTIREQKELPQHQIENKNDYFNFLLFKIRKTSLIIAILGLLIFILTLFCMKQQNDYAILLNEYLQEIH